MKLIVDPGSTHMGKLEYAKELLEVAADAGADAIKYQMITKEQEGTGNQAMSWYWIPELLELGDRKKIEVFASVFDRKGAIFLHEKGARSVKFSYAMRNNLHWLDGLDFDFIYLSYDTMNGPLIDAGKFKKFTPLVLQKLIQRRISLYCIPEYPVKYRIDFDRLFPSFSGFSSHCMGIEQDLKAKEYGARYLEKHITLNKSDIVCPDHCFALPPKELCRLAKLIK